MGPIRCLDPVAGFGALIDALHDSGYRVVGPVVRDGVIAYDDVTTERDLPEGCVAEQAPGRWRLVRSGGTERFSWTPASDSWKRFVFPPRDEVLRVRRTGDPGDGGSFAVTRPAPPERPLALIGARDCEIRALAVLDGVFAVGEHPDPRYAARRAGMFVVAVTCSVPAPTCWCTSMGGGPRPETDFDLRLTELANPHRLLVSAGSQSGRDLLDRLPTRAATAADLVEADKVLERALAALPVRVDGSSLPQRLAGADTHPHWDDVAARCLSCGNCTSVCPTCFCSSFDDVTALAGADGSGADEVVREQRWASCFELDHSNLGGRPVRATVAARYRQWLTHKLQTWPEQFGTSGCVGCGRCTTWCPAGIDLPEEVRALTADASPDHPRRDPGLTSARFGDTTPATTGGPL